jgi:hypothetical protein
VVVDRRVLQVEGAHALYMQRGCRSAKRCQDARAKDQGVADDEDDRRFDGNPDE